MTHGAFDLSGLKRPTPAPAAPPAGGAAGGTPTTGAYTVPVSDEAGFQAVVEASMTAPVVMVFTSPSRMPASADYGRDVASVVEGYDGRFLAALVDADQAPALASALQVQQVPTTYVLLDGRPAMQPIPGVVSTEELQALFQQLGQQLTMQGITARHQPRHAAAEDGEEGADPRYAAAEEALVSGDIDSAVAEYQKLVDGNPADTEAARGLAMAKVLQRTQGVDAAAARAAAENADDLHAQIMAADLDLLDGRVEEAFARLVDTVARTAGDERTKAREHLISLFEAVGNDDQRVLTARRNLASALF
ncbi:co-chaperone YbbN [Nocardioides sp. Kera G14]|uniref:co-chaperone YbbN n=1 Tax=Nocardioides sp. Kera G14 TaxID=2884264 RepID=UPI001D1111CB|nr:tetratricopeptide repeat protein [Nocardioides sp. Kera G14]UDY24757.1 tetratricopeptide repeat protein [Nocardioides sp. Kera G14]